MYPPSVSGDGIDGLARWSLRLFGGFELSAIPGGEKFKSLGKREQALLAYLALCPNSGERRRKLATLLWCDSDDETAVNNLRTCLWRLRKALGDSEHRIIASEGEEILLDRLAFKVDALALRQLAAQSVAPASLAYANTSHLIDITSGLATGICSVSYLCKAGKGYDGPTGLGTPRGIGAY